MNREDIIKLAREAGFERDEMNTHWAAHRNEIERFAALVAAAEREACAQLCDAVANDPGEWAYERATAEELAIAIRKRSNT